MHGYEHIDGNVINKSLNVIDQSLKHFVNAFGLRTPLDLCLLIYFCFLTPMI